MATIIDLQSLDRDIFVRGDDAIARTITLGQTGAVDDDVVVDSGNWGVTAAGVGTFAGVVNLNGGATAPSASSGGSCEVFGSGAGAALTTGFGVNAFGNGALAANTSGNNNIGIGVNAGDGITDGADNIVIGNNAYRSASSSSNEIAIGSQAMRYYEGANSIAIGTNAMAGSQVTPLTANFCVAIGTNVMVAAEGAAWNNIGIGGSALTSLTTATGNTAIGKDGGKLITTGVNNIMIGNGAGETTTTGASNIIIGSGVDADSATQTGQLKIAYGPAQTPTITADMPNGLVGVNMELTDVDATLHVTTDAGDAVSCLKLEQDDTDDEFIDFEGTSTANGLSSISSLTAGNTIQGFYRINVNGVQRWAPFYDVPTS